MKIQTGCTVSLPCGVNDIKDLTINHCDFFFLDCTGCKIIKWSPSFQAIETITLERKYLCLTYDCRENCYWAIAECEPHLIYRLDACFCEVGYITISGAYQQRAISLCCDNCENGIWICYSCQLAFIDKCSEKVTWYKNEDSQRINIAALVQCECRVCCYYEGCRQLMKIQSPCNCESIEICIPKECRIVGIVPCGCNQHCKKCCFCVLLSKVCSHEFVLVEYCVEFSHEAMEHCCSCPCPTPPCPHPPCPKPPKPHCGGCYEIMHSIALEEAGISHILNAEGEKIQKAVAVSDNIEELICVNESVKRTLTQVTLLEGMLYSKLEALVRCDDGCYPKKHGCPSLCSTPLPCCDCDECHGKNACR